VRVLFAALSLSLALVSTSAAATDPDVAARSKIRSSLDLAVQQASRDHVPQGPFPEIPETQAAITAEYAKQKGVDEKEAAAVLEAQRRGTNIDVVLRGALGDDFLGADFDADARGYVAYVSEDADRGQVAEFAKARGVDVTVETRPFTASERDAAADALRERLSDEIKAGTVDVQSFSGEVVVNTKATKDGGEYDRLRALAGAQSVTTRVTADPDRFPPSRTTACGSIWCDMPFRAGERWVLQQNGGFCTSAFPVTSPVDSWHRFVLTAGHCVSQGQQVGKCTTTQCWGAGLGTQYAGYVPGGDGGLLRLENFYSTWGAWWYPGVADSLPTRPNYLPANNEYVCHIGSGYSGTAQAPGTQYNMLSCGNVYNNNTTYWNPNYNAYFYSMIWGFGGCIQGGNSGGAFVNPNTGQAIGMLSTGDHDEYANPINCNNPGWTAEPVANALAVFGVQLMTS
jgi:Trypsin